MNVRAGLGVLRARQGSEPVPSKPGDARPTAVLTAVGRRYSVAVVQVQFFMAAVAAAQAAAGVEPLA